MARAHSRKAWAALRAAYRRGEGTVEKLAPKFGIAHSTAEKRCAREKWQIARQEVARRAEAKAEERDTEMLAEMLSRHRRLTSKLLARAEQLLPRVSKDAHAVAAVARAIRAGLPLERLSAGLKPMEPTGLERAGTHDLVVEEKERPVAPPADEVA